MSPEKINEECLIVLKKINKKKVDVGYVKIENTFAQIMQKLVQICNDSSITFPEIIKYLDKKNELNRLNSNYSYCSNLDGAFQELSVDNVSYIKSITNEFKNISGSDNQKQLRLKRLRSRIKANYTTWSHAYSLKRAYETCRLDKDILIFSHRMMGWSNPVFNITKNLSVEIKTNFGFGRSSYFISVVKFKNFKITPFSHWVLYRYAQFYEIIQYSSLHKVQNESWHEAIEFVKDASNLSMKNENMFIEKYIIDELDKMLDGLNEIMNYKNFYLYNERNIRNWFRLSGHDLVNFRAEKISGSLDFIESILNFNEITATKTFADRIERINKETQPMLTFELKKTRKEIQKLELEKDLITPKFEKSKIEFEKFERKIKLFENRLLKNNEISVSLPNYEFRLEKKIAIKYPNYENVKLAYKKISLEYNKIESQIQIATNSEKIVKSCLSKIKLYFKNKT